MLCDELIANGAPGSGVSIDCMLPRIKSAARFILAPDFAAVADALSGDYTGLVKAFAFCRLPYKTMWVEVVQNDRPQFSVAPMQVPKFQVSPKRVGYLLEATRDDLSAWKTHLFWNTDLGCSCPPLAMQFDMTNELTSYGLPTVEQQHEAWNMRSRLLDAQEVPSHPGWQSATDEVKLTMLRHTEPCIADYGAPVPFGMSRKEAEELGEALAQLARSDWAGEPAFVLAVVGLINARNAVEVEPVDRTKLNKARAKRGAPPLLEHKVLKIAQRQVRRVYPEGAARGDHAPMRGHFVRGHWKVRKTGIYFWHPHARGDFKRGHIEKDYELT